LNKSFLLSQKAAASTEVKSRTCWQKKFMRAASFSVSGSTASGLLLFSWGGRKLFYE